MRAVEDGTLSVGQMRSGLAYEAHLSAEKDRNDRLQRDVPRGDSIDITCHVTGKEYSITSFKGDVMAPENEAGWTQTDLAVRREDGGRAFKLSKDTSSDVGFTKRKHFYLYSTRPGYGKTTSVNKILKWFNASVVNDRQNWTNVSPDAQFLIIDEYGPKTNRLDLDSLKRLTSGNAATFSGNRKSYGGSYTPRSDAQLIILSNYHLFQCMGEYDRISQQRTVSESVARILRDRFFIYRMDEDVESGETELADARAFCENPDADCFLDKDK